MKTKSLPTPCVLACVTNQLDCERLIYAGKKIADSLFLPLQVISVQTPEQDNVQKIQILDHLFNISKSVDAEMTVYYHQDAALITATHMKKNNVVSAVTGMAADGGTGPFIDVLHKLVPEATINMVSKDGVIHTLNIAPEYAEKVTSRTMRVMRAGAHA